MFRLSHAAVLVCSVTLGVLGACSNGGGGGGGGGSGSLSGTVLSSPDPVGGVLIEVLDANGQAVAEATTSSLGFFSIDGIPKGTYDVHVSGTDAFDAAGNPVADKVSLTMTNVAITRGDDTVLGGKPVFLPPLAGGTELDAGGGTTVTVLGGTVIGNEDIGVFLVFEADTLVTFIDAADTTLSVTHIPIDEIPMSLPDGVASAQMVSFQVPGATFDIPPKVIFPNWNGTPAGTPLVPLHRFDHDTGVWVQFGTGTVTADGLQVVSDPGSGLPKTGWGGPTAPTFCTTTVAGRVVDGAGTGVGDVLVTTTNGTSGTTDAGGNYSIGEVPIPAATFMVVATAAPLAPNSGFGAATTPAPGTLAVCDGVTSMPDLVLPAVTVDETAPMVIMVTPVDGAFGVLDNAVIQVVFDDDISPGSLSSMSIQLDCGLGPVDGVVGFAFGGGMTTATFLPLSTLPLDATCTLTVTTDVEDEAGNNLAADFVSSFDTAVTPGSGTTTVSIAPPGPLTLDPGMTQGLVATVLDATDSPIQGALISWASDNSNIASIDDSGLLTARLPGEATITATFGMASATVMVTVNTPPVVTVTVSPSAQTMLVGAVQGLVATAEDAGMNPLSGVAVTWTSDDDLVATVDAAGSVLAVAPGVATITAAVLDDMGMPVSGAAAVTVVADTSIQSITVSPPSAMLDAGQSLQYSALAHDGPGGTGNVIPGVPFVWASDTPAVATVHSSLGLATAVSGPGEAVISATNAGVSGSATLVVSGGVSMTVQLIGGPMGNAGIKGIRVLRNDPTTGAFLAEATTDSRGMVTFEGIATSRTTISLVELEDPNDASITTLLDISVSNLVLHGFELSPTVLASFCVDLNPVPAGQTFGWASTGSYGDDDAQPVFGTVACFEIEEVQPDGFFSVLTMANGTSGRLEGCGMLLDQDPATAIGTIPIDTTLPITSVPYTANAPIAPIGLSVLRKGMFFEMFLDEGPVASSGSHLHCDVPGADKYSFEFENFDDLTISGSGVAMVFSVPPASFNVPVPDLGVANVAFDFASQTLSWTTSGTDLSDMDASDSCLFWTDGGGNFIERCFFLTASQTSIVMPELPADLSAFVPPATGVGFEVGVFGLDTVVGLDALLAAVSANGGTLEGVVFQSTLVQFAFMEAFGASPLPGDAGQQGHLANPVLHRQRHSHRIAGSLRLPSTRR